MKNRAEIEKVLIIGVQDCCAPSRGGRAEASAIRDGTDTPSGLNAV